MRKLPLFLLFLICGVVLAGCATPPPLVSDKYLKETSLVSEEPCGPPCFQEIIVGQTTFVDALAKVRNNAAFTSVQSQERNGETPAQASWAGVGGESCCQMIENVQSGVVEALLIRLAPNTTIKQVVDKQGDPSYVLAGEYTAEEAVIQLLYPDKGVIVWVVPGNAESALEESDPVVAILYLDPKVMLQQLDTVSLQAWNGYQSYKIYKDATPIRTAIPTITPSPAP